MDAKTQGMIKELEKKGYKIKLVVETTKKTFEVPTELLNQFMAILKAKKLRVKNAITEAVSDWVKKNS